MRRSRSSLGSRCTGIGFHFSNLTFDCLKSVPCSPSRLKASTMCTHSTTTLMDQVLTQTGRWWRMPRPCLVRSFFLFFLFFFSFVVVPLHNALMQNPAVIARVAPSIPLRSLSATAWSGSRLCALRSLQRNPVLPCLQVSPSLRSEPCTSGCV